MRFIRCFGSRLGVISAAMMPGTMLIRNSQGHDQVLVMKPPTTGPMVGASTATTPPIVVATACSRAGNSRNTAENTTGINRPPKKPCSTRNASSMWKLQLIAQPSEAAVKMLTAPTNSQRRLKTRVSRPVSGMAMISAIRYAVWTQLMASGVMPSASWIVGSDVATTWMSRIAMNMPTHIRMKPSQVARPGVSCGVAGALMRSGCG